MLDYIRRDPNEVIGVVSPGEGLATIEKIAINAAMAGCLPEYLPVVIAAVEAMVDENSSSCACSVRRRAPRRLAIISGPVVRSSALTTVKVLSPARETAPIRA
jgi:hypothetical protein